MLQAESLTPPKAAAFAGIIFSALMIASLGIIRVTLPDDLASPGIWLTDSNGRNAVRLALNLVPFGWNCFPLVHRRAAQQTGGIGRSVFCDRIPG